MRRRGFTLVEMAVAAGLLAGLFTFFFVLLSGSQRQGTQVEERSDLLEAGIIVQEALGWDLRRSLALGVLPAADRGRGQPLTQLVLPRYSGYDGREPLAFEYQPLVYRFEEGRLMRGDEVVVGSGLSGARFSWTTEHPTELVVELVGENSLGEQAPVHRLRLPAPPGTDRAVLWRRHARHLGARRKVAEEGEAGDPIDTEFEGSP